MIIDAKEKWVALARVKVKETWGEIGTIALRCMLLELLATSLSYVTEQRLLVGRDRCD